MELKQVVEILENEKACVVKADNCGRKCKKCSLIRPSKDIITAYDKAISWLNMFRATDCHIDMKKTQDIGKMRLGSEIIECYVGAVDIHTDRTFMRDIDGSTVQREMTRRKFTVIEV